VGGAAGHGGIYWRHVGMEGLTVINLNQELATITAFLYAGALQHPTLGIKPDIGLDLDNWGGHIGFVGCCTEYADAIQKALNEREDEEDVWPGVIEYELLEPLGEWLLTHETPPEVAIVAAEFMARFLTWIK